MYIVDADIKTNIWNKILLVLSTEIIFGTLSG